MQDFDQFMLNETPYFIAHKYRQILQSASDEERVRYSVQLYELAVRTLAIGLVIQYLVRDATVVSFHELNQLIEERLPIATLRVWEEILFSVLRVYSGKREKR